MKNISRILMGVGAVLLSCNVMAGKMMTGDCPTIADVQMHAKFTTAKECSDGDGGKYWCMTTDAFASGNDQWNVAMVTAGIDAKNSSDALSMAPEYFQNNVKLNEPQRYDSNGMVMCLYDSKDNDHMVAAINPPIKLPDSMMKFMR